MSPFKAILPAALLALCGCKSPVDVTLEFHQALSLRDGERALGMVSAGTRAELERRARQAEQQTGGALAADAAEMIAQGDLSIYPAPGPTGAKAATAKLLSKDDRSARVAVTIGDASSELSLVHETGGWRLELPLAPRPAAP